MRELISTAALAVFLIQAVQAQPCTYSLSPSSASVAGDKGSSGTITVTMDRDGCPLAATATESWINVAAVQPTGPRSGSVSWSVAANPTLAPRVGVIQIGNASFTITQAAGVCSFSLSSSSANFSAAGGTGSFQVATQSACSWSAVSSASWLTITSGASGTGAGAVVYTVAANPTALPRSATITVGTQTFTLTQAASACLALASSSVSVGAAGGAYSVSITATPDCAWTAISNADWITITSGSSGLGSGAVYFYVSPNAGALSRTGTISIGTSSFTVNQSAPCVLTFNPVSANFPASGGTGSITVTASASSCDRSASSDSPWLTINSGASGTGSGTITYTVAANDTAQPRTATITIGGQAYTVTQAAASCTIVLTPAFRAMPASGGSGSLTVTTSCAWTASSTAPEWLRISSGASGTGNGTISYVVEPNGGPNPRSGSILVGDQVFNITQAGVGCAVSLSPVEATVPAEGGAGAIEVRAAASCGWSASSRAAWITVLPPARGEGDGTVLYSVEANGSGQARTGLISIGDQIFTVVQQAAGCTYSLSANTLTVPAAGGKRTVTVYTACSWTALSNASWIMIEPPGSGTGEGALAFSVTANPATVPRTGTIKVGDQTLTVTQAGAPCAVSLSPTEASVSGLGGAGSFRVSAAAGCSWTPVAQADWIQIVSWSNVSGTGVVNYSYQANPASVPRTGAIDVAGQTFTVRQGPAEVRVSSVVNGASRLAGPVAPGLIVTIAGQGMGPAQGVVAAGARIGTELAGTRVFFDDIPGPVLYASDTQVNAIVPYAVAGKQAARLTVEYRGVRSAAVELEVAPAAPALFTLDGSGAGQGAILNQDYSVNGPSNPAARNSVVILYATGEGQTKPPGEDGKLAADPLPRPVLPVSVEIGGVDAPVLYAGGAPGLVAGVMQLNVRVPARAPTGSAVPVRLKVGAAQSQPGVSMAVK